MTLQLGSIVVCLVFGSLRSQVCCYACIHIQRQQSLFTQQALRCMWPRDDLAQVVGQELGEREVLF